MKKPRALDENVRQARMQHYYDTVFEIEGPADQLACMSSLTMQWFDAISNDRRANDHGYVSFSEEERRILAFALEDITLRAKRIDTVLSAPFPEAAQ